ncbi:unnamed protein product, partial [Meganyctiphanes norvegica]
MLLAMEGLECDVCHEIMIDDKLRPRSIRCGHTACRVCVKKLIRNSTLECPACRQSYQVSSIDDLPVNFGMIKMIRALKGVTILNEPVGASAIPPEKNLCSIHGFLIVKRCQKCQVWICEHCIELHRQESGCSVSSVEDALKDIKENHIKSAQSKMDHFKNSLQVVSERIGCIGEKISKLEEEVTHLKEDEQRYTQILSDSNGIVDAVMACHNSLNSANTPQDVNDHIHNSLQRECYLELWTKKNIPDLYIPKMFMDINEVVQIVKNKTNVYSTLSVEGTKYGGKLYLKNDILHLDTHKADPIPSDAFSIPYEDIMKLVESPAATFIEISIDGTPKVQLHIKLHKNMPNMAKNFTNVCSGEFGTNLIGLGFLKWGKVFLQSKEIVKSRNSPHLPLDNSRNTNMTEGCVVGCIQDNGVSEIGFAHKSYDFGSIQGEQWNVVGEIIVGLQSFKSLKGNTSITNVKISNCGLILQT